MASLTPTVTTSNGTTTLALKGSLVDGAYEVLAKAVVAPGSLVVDFSELTFVNSAGMRDWSRFLTGLPANKPRRYVNCPPVVLDAINLASFFAKGATVESAWTIMWCPRCEQESRSLVRPMEDLDAAGNLRATFACATCADPLEPRVPLEIMFAFLPCFRREESL